MFCARGEYANVEATGYSHYHTLQIILKVLHNSHSLQWSSYALRSDIKNTLFSLLYNTFHLSLRQNAALHYMNLNIITPRMD